MTACFAVIIRIAAVYYLSGATNYISHAVSMCFDNLPVCTLRVVSRKEDLVRCASSRWHAVRCTVCDFLFICVAIFPLRLKC